MGGDGSHRWAERARGGRGYWNPERAAGLELRPLAETAPTHADPARRELGK